MTLESTPTATEQPAQVEQTSSEKKTGAANTSVADFAKALAGKQSPSAFEKAVEVVKAVETPAQNEEAEKVPVKAEETETEAQAAEETDAEEVLSPETHTLDPKLQQKIDRRIGKVTARAKAAELRIAELEAKLAVHPQEVEKEVPVPVITDAPLGHITTLDQLNQYRDALTNDIVEAEMLLHSDFPAEGLDTKWGKMTKPALITALTLAKKDERMAIPAREKFLAARTQSQQSASEEFPFLKDQSHPGYQMARQALRDNPILRAYPNSDYLVGLLVEGQLAIAARKGAKPAATATTKPKPKPTSGQSEISSDASITRAPTGVMAQQALAAERNRVTGGKKSLGHKDFAELLKANQRFRNSQ
jgi:hypothetical protein